MSTRVIRARRLAGQSAVYAIAGGLGKALALVTVPILTRILSPEEYGLADLANTFASMLAMIAMCAGDIPAGRALGLATPPEHRRILSAYVWTRLFAGLLISAILLPLAPTIASGVWSAAGADGIALLAILLVPVGAFQATLATTQRLLSKPTAFAVLASIDLLGQMLLAVVFVLLGWGALGMVLGFFSGSAIGLAVAVVQTRQILRYRPDWRLGIAMLIEGIPFLPATVGFVAANYVVRYLLVQDLGQAEVGLFGVAMRISGGMALITSGFSMAWGPMGLALPNTERTARLFGRVIRGYALVAVCIALTVGALGPELITLISGPEYVDAATILPGLLTAAAMAGAFYVLVIAAGVSRRGQWVAVAAMVGATVQVAATALLLPLLGLPSAGIAAMVGQAIPVVVLVLAVRPSIQGAEVAVVVMCLGSVIAGFMGLLIAWAQAPMAARVIVAIAAGIGGLFFVSKLGLTTMLARSGTGA